MFSPDLTSGQRIYSYVVSGITQDGSVSGFPFVDSSGGRINCNYFEVTVHYKPDEESGDGALNRVIFHIEPSGQGFSEFSMVDHPDIAQDYNTDDVAAGNVSGVCGYAGFAELRTPGHIVYKCDNGAIANSVNVKLDFLLKDPTKPGLTEIEFTYGNITPFNTLRQDRYDKGS